MAEYATSTSTLREFAALLVIGRSHGIDWPVSALSQSQKNM